MKDHKQDAFLSNDDGWDEEIEKLRIICQDCGLTEEIKWGKPTYSYQDKNIVVIQGFKKYCALLFLKGYLVPDPNNILIKTGENTVVGRQIRFTDVQEIYDLEPILKSYVLEAVEVEKSGIKGDKPEKTEIPLPIELEDKLNQIPELATAFYGLTPGRQKGYIFYFSQPKQSKTREDRILKYMPQILAGKGIND